MNDNQAIKDTLDVIRKALEDDEPITECENSNILILDKLVNEDGTIKVIKNHLLNKKDTVDILNKKLDEVFSDYLTIWFDKNIPNYLNKYFKKKDI